MVPPKCWGSPFANPGVRAALLLLVHLQPGGDDPAYLSELRLQNLAQLDLNRLTEDAGRSRSPKLKRAAQTIAELAAAETYEML